MVHPPLKSFRVHFEYIFFWSGRLENPIREKYVSMLDHPWFFALFLLLRAAELCRDTENQIACASLIANLFIYYFFFFIRELTTKSFARTEENMWRTLDRIIIFSSFMFIRRRIRCNLSSLLSSRKISSTPRSSSFDRRVRNSN